VSRRAAAALAAISAAALALRVGGLGRLPLWLDEGFSYLQVTHRPLADWRLDVHPPLYYALLWVWAQVLTTDAWLRLPSALLGAAAVPVVYALGARLLGRAAGMWAATYIAVTWMHVWHSRQARMYSLLTAAFALALWGLVTGAREGRAAGWAVYAIGGAAMAWTHAVGIYYAAIVAVLALAIPRPDGARRLDARWLGATAAIVLLFTPWAPVAVARTAAFRWSVFARSSVSATRRGSGGCVAKNEFERGASRCNASSRSNACSERDIPAGSQPARAAISWPRRSASSSCPRL